MVLINLSVGDCYVAVTGLPNQRKDHAVLMCRFARECMHKMWTTVKKLETTLGPETADLTCRMGIHSYVTQLDVHFVLCLPIRLSHVPFVLLFTGAP